MSISLIVSKREVTGKKVGKLYRDGLVIGNVFGRGKPSVAIQTEYETMRKIIIEAGMNHAIELKVEGEGDHLVLIKNIDHNPRTGRIRHVEFHMVNRNEKVEAEIPVELVGTSPAVLAGNMIMTVNDTVLVECLPTALPDHFEISAELLVEPEDMVTAASITLPANVELLSEVDLPLFKVEMPRSNLEPETTEGETDVTADASAVPADHGSDEEEKKD